MPKLHALIFSFLILILNITLAANAADLNGVQVTTGVYCCTAPVPSDLTSNLAVRTVGEELELPTGSLVNDGGPLFVIPVSIDFTATGIDVTYTAAAVAASGSFNGYLFQFDLPTGHFISAVNLNAVSNFVPVAVSFTDNAVTIDVADLVVSAGSRAVVDVTVSSLLDDTIATLVEHYYLAILNRSPDMAGQLYWESEARRVQALGADIQEAFRVMAGQFFASAEYLGQNNSDTLYITDLYETFFNRSPDASGTSYWAGLLAAGLPRDIVLYEFLFSDEFAQYMQDLFGDTATRPEVNLVMDLYRGILGRLPDDGGFNFLLNDLRNAQCDGAVAVANSVDIYSREFIESVEYFNRDRSDGQYIQDLYYAFLRRGGDLAGYEFWVNQLTSGAQTRERVRQGFVQSPEFQDRVLQVINAGCLP